jgi:hypothetical protein
MAEGVREQGKVGDMEEGVVRDRKGPVNAKTGTPGVYVGEHKPLCTKNAAGIQCIYRIALRPRKSVSLGIRCSIQ